VRGADQAATLGLDGNRGNSATRAARAASTRPVEPGKTA